GGEPAAHGRSAAPFGGGGAGRGDLAHVPGRGGGGSYPGHRGVYGLRGGVEKEFVESGHPAVFALFAGSLPLVTKGRWHEVPEGIRACGHRQLSTPPAKLDGEFYGALPLELPAKADSSRILQSVSLRLPAPLHRGAFGATTSGGAKNAAAESRCILYVLNLRCP